MDSGFKMGPISLLIVVVLLLFAGAGIVWLLKTIGRSAKGFKKGYYGSPDSNIMFSGSKHSSSNYVFCGRCGTKVISSHKYCPKCGERL